MKIDASVSVIIGRGTVDGNLYYLPDEQLDRKTYVAVNKVLVLLGGKWNKGMKAHIFASGIANTITDALQAGNVIDEKKDFNMFFTPEPIIRKMIEAAGGIMAGRHVLEPSAGSGGIVRMVAQNATGFDCCKVTAVELNTGLIDVLKDLRQKMLYANSDSFRIVQSDFIECSPDDLGLFDTILMNPPFVNGTDIKHIIHALTFLKPKGTMVTLCANGPRQREKLLPVLSVYDGTWEDLPRGSFKQEGTMVNAAMLTIRG